MLVTLEATRLASMMLLSFAAGALTVVAVGMYCFMRSGKKPK